MALEMRLLGLVSCLLRSRVQNVPFWATWGKSLSSSGDQRDSSNDAIEINEWSGSSYQGFRSQTSWVKSKSAILQLCLTQVTPNSSVPRFRYLLNFHSTYSYPLHEAVEKVTGKKENKIVITVGHVKDIVTAQQMLTPVANDSFPGPGPWLHSGWCPDGLSNHCVFLLLCIYYY